jgi:peptidoglycan/LPS O-acetylase OafA/YrhL
MQPETVILQSFHSSAAIGDLAKSRNNNFNLLRFVAATMVLFSHSFTLATGDYRNEPINSALRTSFGQIAVDMFFVTSGFLVTGSLLRRRRLWNFVRARLLRIYPGYWVATLLTLLFCAFFISTLRATQFWSDPSVWFYIWRHFLLVKLSASTLPGVFDGIPVSHYINGSIWTLPWELRMYAVLAMAWLGAMCVLKSSGRRDARADRDANDATTRVFLYICVAVATVAIIASLIVFLRGKDSPSAALGGMFFAGVICKLFENRIRLDGRAALAMLALIAAAAWFDALVFGFVYRLFAAYLTLFAAYYPSGSLRSFNRFGDYSYGLYIYAFPIQQTYIYFFPGMRPLQLMAAAFPTALVFAILSWNFVERPCMRLKSRP